MTPITNADQILIRASSVGYLMAKPKIKGETISSTAKEHLVNVYVRDVWGRKEEEVKTKVITKGNVQEKHSITLFCLTHPEYGLLDKNTTELFNAYLRGTPDVIITNDLTDTPEIIVDTKTCWSANTFAKVKFLKKRNTLYKFQGLAYCALTGARKFILAYCLTNNEDAAIFKKLEDESWNWAERDTPNWREIEIIKTHVFDEENFVRLINIRGCLPNDEKSKAMYENFVEIPLKDRVYTQVYEFTATDIAYVYAKIKQAREWMNKEIFRIAA